MNSVQLSWLLAGALAASLLWNLRSAREPVPPARAPLLPAACPVDAQALDLAPETLERLRAGCATSCATALRLEAEAGERFEELSRLLASETLERDEVRELAVRIGELRARALVTCVEAILEVRDVLPPDKLAELFERCRDECSHR